MREGVGVAFALMLYWTQHVFLLGFVCLLRGLYGMVVWVVPHVCAVADVQVYPIAVARQLFHFEMVLKVISWSGSWGYCQICRKHRPGGWRKCPLCRRWCGAGCEPEKCWRGDKENRCRACALEARDALGSSI